MEPNFETYVAATAEEAKALLNGMKDVDRVYDQEKGMAGKIIRFCLDQDRCDVEIVGVDVVFTDVPLVELFPHKAFRLRVGQQAEKDGWVGKITTIDRKVKIKCANGQKIKFLIKEDLTDAGPYVSYISTGMMPTCWDTIVEAEKDDVYSAVGKIPCPGNQITLAFTRDLKAAKSGCIFDFKDWCYNRAAALKDRDWYPVDIVKKVKISNMRVEWTPPVNQADENDLTVVDLRVPIDYKSIDEFAEDLAQLTNGLVASGEVCEEGSLRMYTLKGNETIKTKKVWLKEKLEKEGAPRCITVDEVDKSIEAKEWQKEHGFMIKDDVAIKVLTRKRFVEVLWENEETEILSLDKVAKMIPPSTSGVVSPQLQETCEVIFENDRGVLEMPTELRGEEVSSPSNAEFVEVNIDSDVEENINANVDVEGIIKADSDVEENMTTKADPVIEVDVSPESVVEQDVTADSDDEDELVPPNSPLVAMPIPNKVSIPLVFKYSIPSSAPPPIPPRRRPPPPPTLVQKEEAEEDLSVLHKDPGRLETKPEACCSKSFVEEMERRFRDFGLDNSCNSDAMNQSGIDIDMDCNDNNQEKDPAEYCSHSTSTSSL